MAQFQYTAVNDAGKKLSGVIGALTENEARKQLNTFGISILEIKQMAETATKSATQEPGTSKELQKFEFEAYDKTGQKIVGSIPASNRYKAFKRLIEEYKFEISYIVPIDATPEEKEKAKKEDLAILKAEYQTQVSEETAKETEEEGGESSEDFEKKRQALLKKVDFILEKIKQMLVQFDKDIKPENRKIIQDTVDKLLRIKSSTNLDYIEHTSEDLLRKVQDQELFLHKEQMESQREKLKLETQQLMADLHSRPEEEKTVIDDLEGLSAKLEKSKNPLMQGLKQLIGKFLPTEEEKEVKNKISVVSKQIWTLRKIWLTAPKSTKVAAKESLNRIVEEKQRLKAEFRALKAKRKVQSADANTKEEPLIMEELNQFLGWLLGFYLLAYFASHYIVTKSFSGESPFGNFNLMESGVLRYLLLSVFLWYILINVRVEYFRYKDWANSVLITSGIILNATLIFNL